MITEDKTPDLDVIVPVSDVPVQEVVLVDEDKSAIEDVVNLRREELDVLATAHRDEDTKYTELTKEEQEELLQKQDPTEMENSVANIIRNVVFPELDAGIKGNVGNLITTISEGAKTNSTVLKVYNNIYSDTQFISTLTVIHDIMKENNVALDGVTTLPKVESVINATGIDDLDDLTTLIKKQPLVVNVGFCPCIIKDLIPNLIELNTIVSGLLDSLPCNKLVELAASESIMLTNPNLPLVMGYTMDINKRIFTSLKLGVSTLKEKLPDNDDLLSLSLTLNEIYAKHGADRANELLVKTFGCQQILSESDLVNGHQQILSESDLAKFASNEGLTEEGIYDESIVDFGNCDKALNLLTLAFDKYQAMRVYDDVSDVRAYKANSISRSERKLLTLLSGYNSNISYSEELGLSLKGTINSTGETHVSRIPKETLALFSFIKFDGDFDFNSKDSEPNCVQDIIASNIIDLSKHIKVSETLSNILNLNINNDNVILLQSEMLSLILNNSTTTPTESINIIQQIVLTVLPTYDSVGRDMGAFVDAVKNQQPMPIEVENTLDKAISQFFDISGNHVELSRYPLCEDESQCKSIDPAFINLYRNHVSGNTDVKQTCLIKGYILVILAIAYRQEIDIIYDQLGTIAATLLNDLDI